MEYDVFSLLGAAAEDQDFFFVYSPVSRRFEHVSAAFARLLKLSEEAIMDQPENLLAYVSAEDREYLASQFLGFRKGSKLQAEFRLNISEVSKYVQLTAYWLAEDPEKIAGWVTDINVTKKNILYAEKINARKNSLLEVLAHDLKEPVGMINMMASAIKSNPAVVGNSILEGYVDVIQQLCEGNIRLIKNVVHEEFLEAQQIELRVERADIVSAVEDVVRQYQVSQSLTLKTFGFHCQANTVYLLMDTLKIIQAVNNLIANAIKFTPDGGLIDVNISDLGDTVRISVTDNGIGIPGAIQPFLFQPHSRAQRPGLRGEPGTGMGLSIIRNLTELHAGRIWLDTGKQSGTTFHIELPKGY